MLLPNCRPLGVLLDNVANGWSYQPISWADVAAHHALEAATGSHNTCGVSSCGSGSSQAQQVIKPLGLVCMCQL